MLALIIVLASPAITLKIFMSKFRRLLTITVMVMTVVVMSGIVVAPAQAAVAKAGDLIKMNGLSSVYYLGNDGKRYVFPNEATYFSWYPDWSGVVTVSSTELSSYPLGSNVVMRPGTNLVKITTDPTVYAVEPNGVLRSIVSEANAIALYGSDWAKKVVDVPDSFFMSYTIGTALTVGQYPAGTLVKTSGSADIYYFDGTNYRKFENEAAFVANRFDSADVITTTLNVTAGGTNVSTAEYTNTAQNGGNGVVVGGSGLSIALSSDTAAAGTIIYGQAGANMASFNLTAAKDGDVKVTKVKLKRTGVSSDSTLASSYLYDGATRLTDNASVSSGYITWTNTAGIITIPAGQTKTITVKSDLGAVGSGTVAVAIEAASDIEASGATISGSFPVTGNTMSLTGTADTLATFAFAGSTTPSSDGTPAAGETDYTVWNNAVSVGTRDVYLHSIRFRQIGSISATDLKNIKFYVDGVQKGTTQQLADNYVLFTFDTAVKLTAGSRTLKLTADLENGATRTFSFSMQYAVDTVVTDSEYGANIKATAVPATSTSQTISGGSLTVTKLAASASGNITKDASNASLGKFEFKAYGESIKVEYLRVAVVTASGDAAYALRNGAIYANGVQVGSTASIWAATSTTATYTDFNIGSSLVVVPGSPVTVEIKADIFDNQGANGVDAEDTITARIVKYTNGAQKQTSLSYINVPTAETTDGNALTVKTGTITMTKSSSYGDRTVVVPQTFPYKIASYVIQGNATEAVDLNTLTLSFAATAGYTSVTNITDAYIAYGATNTSIKSSVNASSNTWSINKRLGVNESMTIDVYGKLSSSIVTGSSVKAALKVDGTTVSSATAVNTGDTAIDGQTLLAGAGSIASALSSASPVAQIVKGNQTVDVAKFKLTTANDGYQVTEMKVSIASTTAVDKVILKDGTTTLGEAYLDANGDATFSGLTSRIEANAEKTYTVAIDLATIGTGAGLTGSNVQVTLDNVKHIADTTGLEVSTGTDGDVTAKTIYVYKAIPTISNVALPSTVLTAGTQTLAKVKIASDGEIEWKQIAFTVAKSASTTVADDTLKIYNSAGQEVDGSFTTATADLENATASLVFVATDPQGISSEETYSLKGTVGGTIADNYYFSTSIAQASVYEASVAFNDVSTSTASFVWSDQGVNSHTASTLDWVNGYLVKNLPTDAQTLTK